MKSQVNASSRRGAAALVQVVVMGSLPLVLAIVQDWYVDVNAPGCDTGTGTQADPFCGIMDAVNAASEGDTIHVAPGTYVGNVVCDKDLTLIGTGGQEVTILDGNANGSVVYVADAVVTLSGLTLTNGTGGTIPYGVCGGGLLADDTVDGDSRPRVTLTSCTVSGNSADFGGGVWFGYNDGTLELEDSSVIGNTAGSGGGITAGWGGGSLTLVNSTVSGNVAHGTGGGIYGNPYLIDSSVSDNWAGTAYFGTGGGLSGMRHVVIRSQVIRNTVIYGGIGGIQAAGGCGCCPTFCSYADLTLTNSIVTDNEAPHSGGIEVCLGSAIITNSTISHNTDTAGFSGGLTVCGGTDVVVTNSILSGNGAVPILVDGNGSLTIDYSLVEGGWPGTGNIDADPLFVGPMNGDYRLMSGSPCIDAGDNTAVPSGITTDIRGFPRFLEDLLTPDAGVGPAPVVDMGAFEVGIPHARRVRRR